MEWKIEIEKQIKQATDQRKIPKELKKLAKLLLSGDTRFILVFLSGRGQFGYLSFKEPMTRTTALLLLKNGYKQIYLKNK